MKIRYGDDLLYNKYDIDCEIKNLNNLKEKFDMVGKRCRVFINDDKFKFSNRIDELKSLANNWDDNEGIAPNIEIINKVVNFLENMPEKFSSLLNDGDIFTNIHGTITVEWRKHGFIASIEFGLKDCSFYSLIDNQFDSLEYTDLYLCLIKLTTSLNTLINK